MANDKTILIRSNVQLHPEVLAAAVKYAVHAIECERCDTLGIEVCPTGLALLQDFNDALVARSTSHYDS